MGIIIRAAKPYGQPPPVPIEVILECDEPTDMSCWGIAKFTSPDGYVGAHALAMQAGWLERQSSRGRLWICPACSGKA